MKTVVITGSGRGFGYEMAKIFRKNNFNVVICDNNLEVLDQANVELSKISGKGSILSHQIDVTDVSSINNLINKTLKEFKSIDIWINNAGVNQSDNYFWDLEESEISKLIDINLNGVLYCSKEIINVFIKQGYGALYSVEGHGSNDAIIPKLTLYGTSKRAITYYMKSLSKEVEDKNIIVGRITPGIMITNFLFKSLGDGADLVIPEKTKKIYNILGDYPSTIAEYIVPKLIDNKKNDVQFTWLTSTRAFKRFMSYPFTKRDLFKDK